MSRKGIEGFEDSTYKLSDLPIVMLAQPTSPVISEENTGVKPGDLYNSVSKESYGSSVELIVYKAWPSRAKFPLRGASKGNMLECASPDGIRGGKGNCKTCPFNNFQLRDRCMEQRTFVVALASDPNNLMRMIFARTSLSAGRQLEKQLAAKLTANDRPFIYGFTMVIGSKRERNETVGANYFIFTAAPGKLVDAAILPDLQEVFEEVSDLRKDDLARFAERMEAGAPFSPEGEPEETTQEGDATPSPDALV